jgi:hypothetical protein
LLHLAADSLRTPDLFVVGEPQFADGQFSHYCASSGPWLPGRKKCQQISGLIVRAILASPQILILDEATSNLNTESEQMIQGSMTALLAGRTTFVIAHRPVKGKGFTCSVLCRVDLCCAGFMVGDWWELLEWWAK